MRRKSNRDGKHAADIEMESTMSDPKSSFRSFDERSAISREISGDSELACTSGVSLMQRRHVRRCHRIGASGIEPVISVEIQAESKGGPRT
jgi:hypothetical protein